MIGSLRGSVLERNVDGTVLLEVGGVGYLVAVSTRVLAELEPGTPVFLYVHHHIREDAQTLFGFTSRDDRQTFQVLRHPLDLSLRLALDLLLDLPLDLPLDVTLDLPLASAIVLTPMTPLLPAQIIRRCWGVVHRLNLD